MTSCHVTQTLPSLSQSPSINFGRVLEGSNTGTGSDYTITWPSSAPTASGVLLIAVITDLSGATTPLISGGSPWIPLPGGSDLGSFGDSDFILAYYKFADVSEPGSYTISYAGEDKIPTSSCLLIELTDAKSISAVSSALESASPPAAESDAQYSCALVLLGSTDVTELTSVPNNYTKLGSVYTGSTQCIAASLNPCGIGLVSPGVWGLSDVSNSWSWTLIIAL